MREREFREWLERDGKAANTIDSRVSNLKHIESAMGDLDERLEAGELETLVALFVYSTEDERAGKPNPSPIEINGDLRTGLATLKSALQLYGRFRDETTSGKETPDPPSRQLTRVEVEAAMDAFDEFLQSGKHSEIFDHFGPPRTYWVRSTRERRGRVYPTKPIVGFVLGKTKLNGGWESKEYAAARLHNSGFIIVGEDDAPILPPENLDHLIRDADRIRLCALNYYIEPAREKSAEEVSIRASDLGKDMDLQNAFPNICSALGGTKLQQLAAVPAPSHTEPNPSSTTIFTYKLNNMPTNLILYGPPGTGKTYATTWEAVRLCSGDAKAVRLENNRKALMTEYHRLVQEERIEFVTFHQSFSYEDFVEGLRPTTETARAADEQDGTPASGGFSLEAHAGVFKVISERARLDTGNAVPEKLDRSRQIYKISLGQSGGILESLDKSLIRIGGSGARRWRSGGQGGDIDWSPARFGSRESWDEFKKEWAEQTDSDAPGYEGELKSIYKFRGCLQVGDYVVIPDGEDSYRAFGKVVGEYEFDSDANLSPHRRRVEWIWRGDNETKEATFLSNKFNFSQEANELDSDDVDWDVLEADVTGPSAEPSVAGARPYVLIIDEINRANISKVFGELITLLETDKRLGCENELKVRLPYSGESFGVPSNLHIIGTMNTADRSIALLDTALRRRFDFRELMPDASKLRGRILGVNLRKLLTTINERIEYLFDREHQIGHAYFIGCRELEDVEKVMRDKIIPLLAEYFYEDWSKVAAVLGDSAGAAKTHFLEAKRLSPPADMGDDESDGEKWRWSVKREFDFSKFEA